MFQRSVFQRPNWRSSNLFGLRSLALGALVGFGLLALAHGSAVADEARARTTVSRVASVPTQTLAVRSTGASTSRATYTRSTASRRPVRLAAQPMTAMQLAGAYGFAVTDSGNHVLLWDGGLRLHLYPGRDAVVLAGKEYTLKDRIGRRGSDILLSSRVVGFLSRKINEFRLAEQAQARARSLQQARTVKLEPLPPLPVKPVVKRTPVKPVARQTAKPRRRAYSGPAADRGWDPPASERAWKWIVLHHSDDLSGNVAKYDDYHRNTKGWENGCGYHFVVGNGSLSGDGEVEVGPRWPRQLQGAHAKVPGNRFNERGIGICLVGDFETGRGPSEAQMDGLVRLVRWLMARYDIAPSEIRGHCDCCSTCCPGKNFPWAELRRRVTR